MRALPFPTPLLKREVEESLSLLLSSVPPFHSSTGMSLIIVKSNSDSYANKLLARWRTITQSYWFHKVKKCIWPTQCAQRFELWTPDLTETKLANEAMEADETMMDVRYKSSFPSLSPPWRGKRNPSSPLSRHQHSFRSMAGKNLLLKEMHARTSCSEE